MKPVDKGHPGAHGLTMSTASPPRPAVTLIGSYPPPHGGQSVHIQSLRHYLRRQGLDVLVVNTGSNKSLNGDGVVSVSSARELLTTLLDAARTSVLHVHVADHTDFRKLVPTAIAAHMRGAPWLATIHSGNSARGANLASGWQRVLARAVLRSAFRLICVNSTLKRHLNEFTQSDTAVTITPFSLDAETHPLPASVEQFLRDHAPVIACIGLYEPTYGFEQAVLLLEQLRRSQPNAGLLLIGDPANSQWCVDLVQERQLAGHVQFCGNLTRPECLGALQRCAVFLRPTLYDGDSLSVREALALGIPVVATITDFRPEGVILYPRHDMQAALDSIVTALTRTRSTGAAATSHDQGLQQVFGLYQDALARRV